MAEALLALLTQQTPSLQTRKGLIINSLQNDFVSSDGKLPVSIPPGYFEKLHDLVTAFREFGEVIWIRSEFESSREVNNDDEGGDSVIIDTSQETTYAIESDEDDERDSPVPLKRQRVSRDQDDETGSTNGQSRMNAIQNERVDEELFLTQTATKEPCCLPGSSGGEFAPQVEDLIDLDRDLVFTSTHYSAFGSPSLLITLRSKLVTDLFLCGGPTNLSVYATAIDAARYGLQTTLIDDCLVARSREKHEMAIKCLCEVLESEVITSSEMIQLLRDPMSFVEEHDYGDANEYLRGDDYEESEHKTNGIHVETLVDEPLEVDQDADEDNPVLGPPLSRPPSSQLCGHLKELRFTPSTGHGAVAGNSTSRCTSDSRKPAAAVVSSPPNAEDIEVDTDLDEPHSQSEHGNFEKHMESKPVGGSEINHVAGNESSLATRSSVQDWLEKTKRATASSKHPGLNAIAFLNPGMDQNTVEIIETDTFEELKARKQFNSQGAEDMKIQPLFGDGTEKASSGSSIMYDLLSADVVETIYDKLNDEITWQRMHHQLGEVPRLVCCQGTIGGNGSMPVYRHPSDFTLPTQQWTPAVDLVRRAAEEAVGHPLNHALLQLYRGGTDYISEHSDKTLDIVKDSYIVNVSFGAQRTMRLRTKREAPPDSTKAPPPRTIHRVTLPHNSMVKMSLATNAEYLHAINADKRLVNELSNAERAFDGHRISLTFRNIGTFLNTDSTRIFGQGATVKVEELASPVINANAAESERLVRAFGLENRTNSVQWENIYGHGFDVLHLT